jgi:hypothetical protein
LRVQVVLELIFVMIVGSAHSLTPVRKNIITHPSDSLLVFRLGWPNIPMRCRFITAVTYSEGNFVRIPLSFLRLIMFHSEWTHRKKSRDGAKTAPCWHIV